MPWQALRVLDKYPGLLALGVAYAWSPLAFGVFATILAVATILFQAHVTARVERRFRQRDCALLGLALQGAAASLFSVAGIVAPVAFTQLFAWIAASRPAILGATIPLGAGLTFSAWCPVAATDADSVKGSTMRAT